MIHSFQRFLFFWFFAHAGIIRTIPVTLPAIALHVDGQGNDSITMPRSSAASTAAISMMGF